MSCRSVRLVWGPGLFWGTGAPRSRAGSFLKARKRQQRGARLAAGVEARSRVQSAGFLPDTSPHMWAEIPKGHACKS